MKVPDNNSKQMRKSEGTPRVIILSACKITYMFQN